jgi:chemotaxis protein methyltransferase CheR
MEPLIVDSPCLREDEFSQISRLIYEHCGINLHDGKKELVRSRLAKFVREGGFKSFEDYLHHVLQDRTGQAFSELVDSLSTNLTSFFRENPHFDYLRREFLPDWLERKRNRRDLRLRAWSAGCSSGEEPYSIAITLLEAARELGRWSIKVLGTDISTRMLETASRGLYDGQRVAPVPAIERQRYLLPALLDGQKGFEVGPELRRVVILKYLNLMGDWPIRGPLDFIFCRNVMIYFDKRTQQRLVGRFTELLAEGGVLFTGHSESLTGVTHSLRYVRPTIYMKP